MPIYRSRTGTVHYTPDPANDDYTFLQDETQKNHVLLFFIEQNEWDTLRKDTSELNINFFFIFFMISI